jgi:hypothetical protein
MRTLLGIASFLGSVGTISSFGILIIGLQVLHLNPLVLQSFIYLKLSVAGALTLFVEVLSEYSDGLEGLVASLSIQNQCRKTDLITYLVDNGMTKLSPYSIRRPRSSLTIITMTAMTSSMLIRAPPIPATSPSSQRITITTIMPTSRSNNDSPRSFKQFQCILFHSSRHAFRRCTASNHSHPVCLARNTCLRSYTDFD